MSKAKKTKPKSARVSLLEAFELEIRGQLAAISKRRTLKGADLDKIALATAALTRSATSLETEKRQVAKTEVRELSSFPLERIVAHLKSYSDEERREICREVLGEDDEEPLL